jgi:hypothetical protein
MKKLAPLLAAALALAAASCATVGNYPAANDIHAFLVSIRDGDRAAFDAHVDKAALKANLRARVMAEVAKRSDSGGAGLPGLGALLAGPLVDVAVDALLRPEVFKAIAEMHGYTADRPIPSSLAITQFVRQLGGGGVCVTTKKNGPCLLDFTDEAGVYKLVNVEGDLSLLRPRR